ncbi:hypothetical protein [Flammeovirga kamogawensis]|uniref:DUF3471 domain-containing protein n=1 Tax=Flammeovirga kamogawensis TaxID=373891 RepID=A0ABX8GTH1_9BACT|nr:hypothetical protein [Flammeovirga kamogawensis]MBB6460101.1 hypothetical protein [Flammeovirga kamogawensis]QWG06856.1 hypothetical protein KM029_16335 [Flammeovirga kamogawensis]TRX68678.1 hypothetical protein EO216_11330 [Flammeovirga kamogawensis]
MKKMIVVLLGLVISSNIFAVDVDKLTNSELMSKKGLVYENTEAINLLDDYIGVYKEGKSVYLYNTTNTNLFAMFKTGIRSASLDDVVKTSQITNLNFTVNGDVKVHVSYYNTSGDIIICSAK